MFNQILIWFLEIFIFECKELWLFSKSYMYVIFLYNYICMYLNFLIYFISIYIVF